jgi:hypothetical protein
MFDYLKRFVLGGDKVVVFTSKAVGQFGKFCIVNDDDQEATIRMLQWQATRALLVGILAVMVIGLTMFYLGTVVAWEPKLCLQSL